MVIATEEENVRCTVCLQKRCDLCIVPCGCLLHTTCIPIDIFLPPSRQMKCPSCCCSSIDQIKVLPLPIATHHTNATSDSVNIECLGKKHLMCYRTGRWNKEESSYANSLIKCFEMGMLPLPHGIKLSDFLCDLLFCRTSRLTKKSKHAKLGSISYRGGISNVSNVFSHGGIIQHAQSLFLKTITPEWVRMEIQFNISRMWRTHLTNFCIQIGYLHLETREWLSSLDAVDKILTSSEDSTIQRKRKRLRMALCTDANNVAESYIHKDLSKHDSAGSDDLRVDTNIANMCIHDDSIGSILPDFTLKPNKERKKFSFEGCQVRAQRSNLKHSASVESIAELLSPGFLDSRKKPFFSVETSDVINDATDSTLKSSSHKYQGKFLETISNFLSDFYAPFQHVELWVPMNVGCSSSVNVTSSSKVHGVIYGDQQQTTIKLVNAGFVTTRSDKITQLQVNRLNEFGFYSENFSFSPGQGFPGRVYSSCHPCWQGNLSSLAVEQFERVGGAAIYGVNTALGVPIETPVGTVVVVFYSSQNMPRDEGGWAMKCIEFCKSLQPEPRWKIVIEVGLNSGGNLDKKKEQGVNIDDAELDDESRAVSSPKISASSASSPIPAAIGKEEPPYAWNEQSLALLIGKYLPLDPSSSTLPLSNLEMGNTQFSSDLVSLRLLLLRHSLCRTAFEINLVNVIMQKYHSYIQARHSEYEIVNFIKNDWKYLVVSQQDSTGNGNAVSAKQTNESSTWGRNSSVPRVVSESGPIKQEVDGDGSH